MTLLSRFIQCIEQKNLFSPADNLLLAVSGGMDSVVLCELCRQSGFDFQVAHCNFQLRGEESNRDEMFVRNLGKRYKVAVHVKSFDTDSYAGEHKLSVQEAARELRYLWFEEIAKGEFSEYNAAVKTGGRPLSRILVLTAHHADDNAETVLMNFCRGTGLRGLTGIPVSYKYLRRPLLDFTKKELQEFARENNLEFVEDSSNLSSKYTRNYFRNEIIPAIAKVFPQVSQNLEDNIRRFGEIEKLYRVGVSDIKKKLIKEKGEEKHIPVKQLLAFQNRALVYEIIRDYGFTEKQVDEVLKLASGESGKYLDAPTPGYRIIKHRHWLIISPAADTGRDILIIEEKDKSSDFKEGSLQFEKLPVEKLPAGKQGLKFPSTEEEAWLDAAKIKYPLILRHWKTGDYFYPLGLKKKKKLSRFFIDHKLSTTQKEKSRVLETNRKIAWVIGMRIDERFKITPATRTVLKIRFSSAQNE